MDISVIVPCFNGEAYLGEALDSILSQEGPTFEVIVVDDGSKNGDQIEAICLDRDDVRVRYVRKENGGVSSALNLGVSLAKSDVFCWLSHDDLFTDGRLKKQWNVWNSIPGRKLLFGNYETFFSRNQSHAFSKVEVENQYKGQKSIYALAKGLVNGCTVMASIGDLRAAGLFNESLFCTQDYDLWLTLEERGVKLVHTPEIFCQTRIHENQTSKTSPHLTSENKALWRRIANRVWNVELMAGDKEAIQAVQSLGAFIMSSEYLMPFGMKSVLAHIDELIYEKVNSFSVGIVVPTREFNFHSERALNSILGQTHTNWEVILINDSQTLIDLSHLPQAIQTKTVILSTGGPKGVSSARNLGLAHAVHHDYIAFLDDDDEFMPSKLTQQIKSMVALDSLFSHSDYLAAESIGHEEVSQYVSTSQMAEPNLLENINTYGCSIATPTVIVASDLIELIRTTPSGVFPTEFNFGEDAVAWIKIISQAEGRVSHLAKPLTIVYSNLGSAKHSKEAAGEATQALRREMARLGVRKISKISRALRVFHLNSNQKKKMFQIRHALLVNVGRLPMARVIYNKLERFVWFQRVFSWFSSL